VCEEKSCVLPVLITKNSLARAAKRGRNKTVKEHKLTIQARRRQVPELYSPNAMGKV
jgi:hypothetical protein